jgi:hypothetical protein
MNESPARRLPSRFAVLPGGDPGISQGGPAGCTQRWRSWVPIAAAFTIALVALVLLLLTAQSTPATLRHLPAAERAALVDHTLGNLRDVCAGTDRPREFCKEQAMLLLQLPECQGACQARARAELLADSAVK